MIFVLDDDDLTLRLTAKALQELGDVKAVTLWSEIGSALLKGGPHLLVCDLQMPGISGLAFCEIVRRHAADCRIVIYSAAIEEAEASKLERLADATVAKQEGLPALLDVVGSLLAEA